MGVTIELDVREDLRQKREPFEKIMNAIKPLQPGDTFILHAPFKPLPLFPTYESERIYVRGRTNREKTLESNVCQTGGMTDDPR